MSLLNATYLLVISENAIIVDDSHKSQDTIVKFFLNLY
jgi:hypothetical protein